MWRGWGGFRCVGRFIAENGFSKGFSELFRNSPALASPLSHPLRYLRKGHPLQATEQFVPRHLGAAQPRRCDAAEQTRQQLGVGGYPRFILQPLDLALEIVADLRRPAWRDRARSPIAPATVTAGLLPRFAEMGRQRIGLATVQGDEIQYLL